jgi:c-di-GMP-binding flagellar brake protein YcgR
MAYEEDDPVPSGERRRYLRIPLDVAVRCQLTREGRPATDLDCRAKDFSTGGISLHSNQPLAAGETLVLSFRLPNGRPGETDKSLLDQFRSRPPRSMEMQARVVWCSKADDEHYQLGAEFVSVDGFAHRPLLEFLRDYGIDPNGETSGGERA